MILDTHTRRYLREMGSGHHFTTSLGAAEIARFEEEVAKQHPEEPYPRQRAIARLAAMRHQKWARMKKGSLLFLSALVAAAWWFYAR